MPKRLAITIAGAVSLGSYEAGVLYEVISAIGQHNRHPDISDNPSQQIEIDVLTGASAGGMTATIAAQKLMLEAGALKGAYTNSFYLPWVADVSLDSLLNFHGQDDPMKSILSSGHIIDISKRHLTARYLSHADPPRERHPACAKRLRLGLALANLNGIDYGLSLRPEGKFIYTRHQDELATWIDDGVATDDTFDFWDALRNAAVSCGAFAFAFRVIDVIRHAVEYTRSNLQTHIAPTQTFSYTDGGTFQNEPLGLAKNLVDLIDGHQNVDSRFYLFVAPGAKSSVASSDFTAAGANFRATALRLVGAIFGQARFQDWIFAEKLNASIEVFNAQARAAMQLFNQDTAAVAERSTAFHTAIDSVLPDLFNSRPAPRAGEPPLETLAAARERAKNQWADEYNSLPAATRGAWLDTVLALESAAQLGTREEMAIYGITASASELASTELSAFAGFFDRRFRDHDYDVGRAKARQFLTNGILSHPHQIGPILYPDPESLRAIDPQLDGLTLNRMDRAPREQVRDRLSARAHDILAQFGIGTGLFAGVVRETIVDAIIKPQLNGLLKL
jgi:Patatin-like phospholipase